MGDIRVGVRAMVLAAVLGLGSIAGPQPTNDDCAGATVIGQLPFSETLDVSAATVEAADGEGEGPPGTLVFDVRRSP